MNKQPYTILDEFSSAKEAAEYFAENKLGEGENENKWFINHDTVSGKFEIANLEEFKKYKKVNDWENERHFAELRKRTYVSDRDDAQVMCEVLVNKYPELYVSALKDYIVNSFNYLNTFETLAAEMAEVRNFIYTGEDE